MNCNLKVLEHLRESIKMLLSKVTFGTRKILDLPELKTKKVRVNEIKCLKFYMILQETQMLTTTQNRTSQPCTLKNSMRIGILMTILPNDSNKNNSETT